MCAGEAALECADSEEVGGNVMLKKQKRITRPVSDLIFLVLVATLGAPSMADTSQSEACVVKCPWPQVPVARLKGWRIQFLTTINDPGFREEYDINRNGYINVTAITGAAAAPFVVHKGTSSACNTGPVRLQDFLRNYEDGACEPPARRSVNPGYSCALASEDCLDGFDLVVPLSGANEPQCLPPSRRKVLLSTNLRTVEKDYDAPRNRDSLSYISWRSMQKRVIDLTGLAIGTEGRIVFTRNSLDGRRQRLRADVSLGCEALPESNADPCEGIEVQDDGSRLEVLSAPAGCTFLTNGCSTPGAIDWAVYDEVMVEACRAHDLCYECAHALGWHDMDRGQCDQRFLQNMQDICDAKFEPEPWYGFLFGSWNNPRYRGQCRTLADYMFRVVKTYQNGLHQLLDYHSKATACSRYIADTYPNLYNGARYLGLPDDTIVPEISGQPLRP